MCGSQEINTIIIITINMIIITLQLNYKMLLSSSTSPKLMIKRFMKLYHDIADRPNHHYKQMSALKKKQDHPCHPHLPSPPTGANIGFQRWQSQWLREISGQAFLIKILFMKMFKQEGFLWQNMPLCFLQLCRCQHRLPEMAISVIKGNIGASLFDQNTFYENV